MEAAGPSSLMRTLNYRGWAGVGSSAVFLCFLTFLAAVSSAAGAVFSSVMAGAVVEVGAPAESAGVAVSEAGGADCSVVGAAIDGSVVGAGVVTPGWGLAGEVWGRVD